MSDEKMLIQLSKILVNSLDLETTLLDAADLLVSRLDGVEACYFYIHSPLKGGIELCASVGPPAPDILFDKAQSFLASSSVMWKAEPIPKHNIFLCRLMASGFAAGVVCFVGVDLETNRDLLIETTQLIAGAVCNGLSYRNLITERAHNDLMTLETRALYQLTRSISTVFETKQMVRHVLQSMAGIFKSDVQAFLLPDGETNAVYLNLLTHFDMAFYRLLQKKIEKTWYVLTNDRLTITEKHVIEIPNRNINTRGLKIKKESHIRSWLSAPLNVGDKEIGLLCVASADQGRFRDFHLEFLFIIAEMVARVLENIRLNEQMKKFASLDGLTGIFNHRVFQEKMEEHFSLSLRYNTPLSLVMLDIDHFKRFNDTHGHQTGDDVLKSVAQTLQETVRDVDVVCRYGGEEFVIILPQSKRVNALQAAERFRKAIETREFRVEEKSLRITASLGVSSFPDVNLLKHEDMISQADTMLYEAKNSGRNRVVAWPGNDGSVKTSNQP